ncbi:hypothetical protein [Streptomyces sp. IGB124]|uniref:hypothetical protein n=1 Tax=Streptomyces sp. IGB124 TaxID=1519485 RepID=UPI0006AF3E87|nr:hypothetical protein [Streptomyces sp. IGB124]KOU68744.1 hypothetical protein ADK96_09425 [Streptomyces sp. IGB124]
MSRSSHKRRQALVVMPAALLMAATTALGTPAHSAPQRAPSATLVSNITYEILNKEDVGRNIHCTRGDQSRETVRYLARDFAFSRTCGGEIRVEIDYRASLNSDRSITIKDGHVKFFEGDSVFTNDQDGGLTFGYIYETPITIPMSQSRTMSFYVANADEGVPDDHATVSVTWTNIKNNQLGRIRGI